MASFASSSITGGARKHTWTNTPGTRGLSRLRDRTLAVPKKRAKMPKYCGKQIFTHGRFPEVSEK